MNFLLLSDIHGTDKIPVSRTDNAFEAFNSKFQFALNYAKLNQCIILQAGDLSDSSRNWFMLDYYLEMLNKYQVIMCCVFGQHDMYYRSSPMETPSTMLTLIKSSYVIPLGAKPFRSGNVNIYGANWGDDIPKAYKGEFNILVLHSPITLKREWSGQNFIHPKRFLRKHPEYRLVLVGDIHRKFIYSYKYKYVVNTGPMLRLEANEYNMKHKPCFFVYDEIMAEIDEVEIPHESADKVLTREHIDKNKMNKEELKLFISNLQNLEPIKDKRRKQISKYIRENINNSRVKKLIRSIINETRG